MDPNETWNTWPWGMTEEGPVEFRVERCPCGKSERMVGSPTDVASPTDNRLRTPEPEGGENDG